MEIIWQQVWYMMMMVDSGMLLRLDRTETTYLTRLYVTTDMISCREMRMIEAIPRMMRDADRSDIKHGTV